MLYLIVGAIAAYAAYHAFFVDNQDDRPTSHSHSRHWQSSQQAPVRQHDSEQQQRQTVDPFQKDYAPLDACASLRVAAKRKGELMAECYQRSQEAYQNRDRARAKALSDEGKRHALEMENLNAKASATIFKENNRDRTAGEVDLHGLYVKEAIAYTKKAISEARRRGDSEIRLIVGQGNHSNGGVPRIKPALQDELRTRGVHVEVDPTNPGVLIVQLDRVA